MEKIFEDRDSISYRFQCDCFMPYHAIDVEVQKERANDVIFYFYTIANRFRDRFRWCWKMLRTGTGFEADFVVREEDVKHLSDIISQSLKKRNNAEKL